MFWVLYLTFSVCVALSSVFCAPPLNGRYTRDIDDFQLTVPFRVESHGEFATFRIPSFYKQNFHKEKRKRSLDDAEVIHYVIHLNSLPYQAQLWPNHGLVSPNAVIENRRPSLEVKDRKMKKMDDNKMCLYTGRIRGKEGSKVAVSTCDGLAGYITVDGKRYFIEPVQEHTPNENGQHLHVLYERHPHQEATSSCGTSSNWEEAWKKRFREEYIWPRSEPGKRSMESVHRYLETMVVCDKKFLEFHMNIDQETYVLTVMNMVADFYHDHTSGNMMDVVVVRIVYLDKEEEEIDLVINSNADDTLASFCKWQQRINPKDVSNPNHHDIAVLLTRYDICADNMSNCGLMGLAYVAGACTSQEPCAINEDAGLVLGIVVAHEMGHVMGCSHDKEEESSCPAQDEDGSYFVMAPFVHLYTTRWSSCSRGFITALFENGLGDCLDDEPEISLYKDRDVLPGVIYDADQQCHMFRPNSTLCPFNKEKICEMLLCQTSPTQCQTKEEPAADGTKCGENKWCYRKNCVQMGQRPEAINGGWGKWKPFTECSRTCGGGVQISSRECDNPVPQHRGRYCLGERKQVKVCNIDPCPPGSKSFREIQCEEHNDKPFRDHLYTWRAYFKQDEPCVLYCLNNANSYSKLEPRVKDGTKCKPGTRDMCISGTCRKLGCDGVLDSDAVEDICGVCNGDGTKCKVVEETYTAPPGVNYVKIAAIPVGSRNVLIEELAPSLNAIAVSDAGGKRFFLNGDHRIQAPGAKQFGEVEGLYSSPEPRKEKLVIHGPLTEELVFYVAFYRAENVGYHYKYAEPSMDTAYVPKYHWEQIDWEECSVRCGGGVSVAKWICVEEKAGEVSDKFCEEQRKPKVETKSCNEEPCKTKWKVGVWGKCHACKNKSGVRTREVECVRESPHPGGEDILVEDAECSEPKPGTRELCDSHKKCKSKRYTDGLPEDMMEEVWRQIHLHKRSTKPAPDTGETADKKSCPEEKKKKLPKLNVGQTIKDRIPPEEIKVIEVPLKQSHLSLNLSDTGFETMGDAVADSLDTSNARIATGESAARILNNMQHTGKHKPKKRRGKPS